MIEKLKNCFDEMVVYKDLKKTGNIFSSLSLPSFMRDWLLKKFEDENGNFDTDDLVNFVKTYLPRKDDWISIKNRVVVDRERVRFLAKASVDIDIKTAKVSFFYRILDCQAKIPLSRIRYGKLVKMIWCEEKKRGGWSKLAIVHQMRMRTSAKSN